MVFVVNVEKILIYKNLETRYKLNKELANSYNKNADELYQKMMKLSNEILKESGVI